MDYSVPEVTSAEREFYGENLILLEGAISEFLSCMDMIRRYEVQLGNRDPVASSQTRIKSAESMRQKLQRLAFPITAESAMKTSLTLRASVWSVRSFRISTARRS